MLRVIKRLKETYSLPIKATFLGAHAVPKEFKNNKQGYLDLIIHEMLPKVAEHKLADFIDIFCETGTFLLKTRRLFWKKLQLMVSFLKYTLINLPRLEVFKQVLTNRPYQ